MRVLQLRVIRSLWSRRAVRWPVALCLGALWWWAALRLAVQPGRAGPVEGVLTAAGWGLGLIPLHAVPRPAARTRRGGPATRAWRPRRWGGGSGRW
ncbi:hypothetical protein M2266_005271 [Streptomyces sp. SPB162]|nr:hypothetical protein [Streptomyces sp. SPB162]MDF9816040.1 hypothetical protein [Streptomyces sp. SPB162]